MASAGEDWKKKYLDSVNAQERKEASWEKRQSVLKKCISRLTFVGDGLSSDLDGKLEELRNRVRGEQNYDQLMRLVEIIVDKAEKQRADEGNGSAESESTAGIDIAPHLEKWLTTLPFQKAQRKKADELVNQLKKQAVSSAVLNEFESLVNDSLQYALSQHEPPKAGGALSKLFSKADKPGQSTIQADPADDEGDSVVPGISLFLFIVDLLSNLDQKQYRLEGLAERAEQVQNEGELQELTREIVELLQGDSAVLLSADQALLQLVERLDISPTMRPQAKALKSQLIKGITQENLSSILDELVSLLGKAQKKAEEERQEVERFLLKLTEQLQELDLELEGVESDGVGIFSASRIFANNVDEHMQGVQTSLDQATEFDELKSAVTVQLKVLHERLKDHRGKEEERITEFEQRIEKLKVRIGEMEEYSEELQKTVRQARAEAFKDALTGLNNRHAFEERLKQEFVRWNRYNFPMSMIVLDVDHFKSVNDNYGHLAGDKVLQVIGKLLNSATREVDFAARYGGEEFIVLLPETDIQSAYKVAEKIRKMVEGKPFHSGESKVTITISAGIAQFKKGDGRKEPFARADEALYRAKREGRNRCYREQN